MAPVLRTPDDRYIVVRGRLWRAANPHMPTADRDRLVRRLMAARRAVATAKRADDAAKLATARRAVQRTKVGLGERGPVWWADGTPDYNRKLIHNTPYRDWFAALPTGATQ